MLFSIPVFTKVIPFNEIVQIKFKREGWLRTGAQIKVAKGFNIRLIQFEPETILIDLLGLARKYKIPILRTEGFNALHRNKTDSKNIAPESGASEGNKF